MSFFLCPPEMNIKCCGNFFCSISQALLYTMKLDFTVNGFIIINLKGKRPDETGECFT